MDWTGDDQLWPALGYTLSLVNLAETSQNAVRIAIQVFTVTTSTKCNWLLCGVLDREWIASCSQSYC